MKHAVLCALLVALALAGGDLQGQSALLSLSFSTNVIEVGTPAVIDLLIDCQVESCAAADLSVQFDPQALRIESIALGDFPTQTGNSAYLLEHQPDDDGAAFTLRYTTRDTGYPASTGTGTLAHITVIALAEGATELRFARASVAPLDGDPVFTPQTVVGTVLARPRPIRRTLTVRAEAREPDQVTVSAPDGAVVSETIVGSTLLIEVDPETDSAAELRIDAPGHLACTTGVSQDREITLLAGDIDNDGIIGILDATAYGMAISGYQAGDADVNHDAVVDIYDLVHVGRNYGLSSGDC